MTQTLDAPPNRTADEILVGGSERGGRGTAALWSRFDAGESDGSRSQDAPRSVVHLPWLRSAAWTVAAFLALTLLFKISLPKEVPFGILLFGVVTGSINALVAVAIILVYRANRIINFAQAEIGIFGAIVFEGMVRVVQLPWIVSLLVGVVASLLLGALLEVTIIRRFASSPRLILTVVTIGLAQIVVVFQFVMSKILSGAVVSTEVTTPFTGFRLTVTGVIFNGDALLLVASVPFIVAALNLFLRRTDFGIAMRAAAESGERAALLGIPVNRVSTVTWAVAGAMVALATILRAPVVGLVAGSTILGPGLLLRALAAAVLAKMENLRTAVLAAVFLGVIEQALYYAYAGSTVVDAVFVAIIIGGLLFQRRSGDRAEDAGNSRWSGDAIRAIPRELAGLREVAALRVAAAALVALPVIAFGFLASESQVNLGAVIIIYAIVAISLVVLTGWAGQLSLGQFGIVGFGAAVSARLSADAGWDFLLSLVGGMLAGAAVAMLLGVVALRVKGFFFAVTSLGFAVAVPSFFLSERYFPLLTVQNRPERPMLFGRYDLESEYAYYWFCLALLVIVALTVRRLRSRRVGRTLLAIKDNERGAQAFGVSAARAKLTAFGVSGALAGLAGGLLAAQQHSVSTTTYAVGESLRVFSMVVIGGVGTITGGILGALYLRITANLLQGPFALLATGVGVLVVLYFLPGGLGRLLFRGRDAILRRIAARRGLVVPSLLADVRQSDPLESGAAQAALSADEATWQHASADLEAERVPAAAGSGR